MSVILTTHAKKQLRKRLGLPKKVLERQAQEAFSKGVRHSEARGKARKWLDKQFLSHGNCNNARVYNNYLYVFRDNVLITVFCVPLKLRNHFKAKEEV